MPQDQKQQGADFSDIDQFVKDQQPAKGGQFDDIDQFVASQGKSASADGAAALYQERPNPLPTPTPAEALSSIRPPQTDMQPSGILSPEERTGSHLVASPEWEAQERDFPGSHAGQAMPEGSEKVLGPINKYAVEPFEKNAAAFGQGAHDTMRNYLGAVEGIAHPSATKDMSNEEAGRLFEQRNPWMAGAAEGAARVAGGAIGDPRNWPLLGASEVSPLLSAVVRYGTSAGMAHGTIKSAITLEQNWGKMTPQERAEALTETGVGAALTVLSADPRIEFSSKPNVKGAVASVFGGKVKAGVGVTPESYRGGVSVGDTSIMAEIPRTPATPEPGPIQRVPGPGEVAWESAKGNLNPRTPLPPSPMEQAANAMSQHNADAARAGRAAAGVPEPQAPAPPAPPPVHEVTPEMVSNLAKIVAEAPKDQRAQTLLELHNEVSQQLLHASKGKVIGPDGKLEIVRNANDAERLTQKWINDEVARQDADAADKAKETAKAEKKQPAQAAAQPTEGIIQAKNAFADVDKFVQEANNEGSGQRPSVTGSQPKTEAASQANGSGTGARSAGVSTEEPGATAAKTGREAYQKGERVALEDGRKGTIVFSSPKDPIVRIRLDGGPLVSKGISTLTREGQGEGKGATAKEPVLGQGTAPGQAAKAAQKGGSANAEKHGAEVESGYGNERVSGTGGGNANAGLISPGGQANENPAVRSPTTAVAEPGAASGGVQGDVDRGGKAALPGPHGEAEKPTKYKYGNTQASIPHDSEASTALASARARISDSDLAGEGRDVGGGDHVTVRYGVNSDDHEGIKRYLSQQAPFEATLGKTESFPPTEHSDGAAVIKAPVESKDLHRMNDEIQKHGQFAPSSFPEYKPHATIAYVKPEKAGRYTGMTITHGKKFTVSEVAISKRDGSQEVVKLEGKKASGPPQFEDAGGANFSPGAFADHYKDRVARTPDGRVGIVTGEEHRGQIALKTSRDTKLWTDHRKLRIAAEGTAAPSKTEPATETKPSVQDSLDSKPRSGGQTQPEPTYPFKVVNRGKHGWQVVDANGVSWVASSTEESAKNALERANKAYGPGGTGKMERPPAQAQPKPEIKWQKADIVPTRGGVVAIPHAEAGATHTYEAEVQPHAGSPNIRKERVQAENRRHAEQLLAEKFPGQQISSADRIDPNDRTVSTEGTGPVEIHHDNGVVTKVEEAGTTNQDRLLSTVEAKLKEQTAKDPKKYALVKGREADVARSIVDAFRKGTADKDGLAVQAALKELGIKNTYKAINEFLNAAPEPAAEPAASSIDSLKQILGTPKLTAHTAKLMNGFLDDLGDKRRYKAGDKLTADDVQAVQDNIDAGEPLPAGGSAPSDDNYHIPESERAKPEDIFPAPAKKIMAAKVRPQELLTPEEAAARLGEWKAEAKRIGRDEDHSNEVVYSLFDRTGILSKPYEEAGYQVRRYDIENGDDLVKFFPIHDIYEDRAAGRKIVGVIAQPPCTSYAVSGAHSWALQHDAPNKSMVEKKYGAWASEYFDTPLDYANTLVAIVQAVVEFTNPSQFHVMENPIGRIATQNDLPQTALVFDPNDYGDPYTKKTQLWGTFNPNLPTARVAPSQGSLITKLRGDVKEQKALRSQTPEGFAYAFFMANHQAPEPTSVEKPAEDLQLTPPDSDIAVKQYIQALPKNQREYAREVWEWYRMGQSEGGDFPGYSDDVPEDAADKIDARFHEMMRNSEPRPEDFIDRVKKDRDKFVENYISANTVRGYLRIAADEARKLFPEYAASKEGARRFTAATNRASGLVAYGAFQYALESGLVKNSGAVFAIGGPGSGKSSAENEFADRKGEVSLYYESTFSTPEVLRDRVKAVDEAGGKSSVAFVFAPPKVALERMIGRSEKIGRYVPLDFMAKVIANVGPLVEQVYADYGNKVDYLAIDNGTTSPKFIPGIDGIRQLADNRTANEIADELHAHARLLHQAGRISDELYKFIGGSSGADRPDRTSDGREHQKTAPGVLSSKEAASEQQNQPERTPRNAENLPSVPSPESQGGKPPRAVSPAGDSEVAGGGQAGSGARPADGERLERPVRLPRKRSKSARGGGSGATDDLAPERKAADGLPVAQPEPELTESAADTVAQLRNQRNFRITDEHAATIGAGGAISKIKGNLDALELLKKIQAEGRELATPEEQAVLSKYVDFGGLVGMLQNPYSHEYHAHFQRFEKILSQAEIAAIKKTLPFTHYTSMEVVTWMWDAAKRMGFRGGRILEPSMGVGNFFGRLPEAMSNRSQLFGVEMNPLTGNIARLLYPDANVQVKKFQDFTVPNGSMNLIVGNPPFMNVRVTDDPAYSKMGLKLHNYFIVKSLDKLKPGGIAMLITTRYTMDSTEDSGQKAREEMAKRADLLTAFRLPENAFRQNAGTDVVADLLVFRKRADGDPGDSSPLWLQMDSVTVPQMMDGHKTGDSEFAVNKYFTDNPEQVLGRHSNEGKMYQKGSYTVKGEKNLGPVLEQAAERFPKASYGKTVGKAIAAEPAPETMQPDLQLAPADVKPGAYFRDENGKLWQKEAGVAKALPKFLDSPETRRHLGRAVDIRDEVNRLIDQQLSSSDDEPLKEGQKRLGRLYDSYVKEFGPLNSGKLRKVFSEDPQYPSLLALESIDPETKKVAKAAIFTKRTLAPYEPLRDLPNDPKSAMLKVMADRGFLDTKLMAELSGVEEKSLVGKLVGEGLMYEDPATGKFLTADEYLSGEVRLKLNVARHAAETDERFAHNVKELEKVQPTPLTIHEIQPALGQTWIPMKIYKSFLRHLAGGGAQRPVEIYRDNGGKWFVDAKKLDQFNLTHKWAGGGLSGARLVAYALNQQLPTIWEKDADGKRYINKEATTAARVKLDEIKKEFTSVLRKAPQDTIDDLEKRYNDTFNGFKKREFSGEHLTFPGMSKEWQEMIRSYQKSAIWRIVQEGRAGIFHAPGLGKTLTMIAAGMEMRRLKLSRKNIYAVPNHMVPQWRADVKRFYPNANVLAVMEEDFDATNRGRLMSRIATGDWDAVIIPHSQFDLLPMSPEWEEKTINAEIQRYRLVLEDLDGQEDRRTIKQIEKAVAKLEARLGKLNDKKKDNVIPFDRLGADMMFVDEAHAYKAMAVPTRMGNIKGISNRSSQRAFALQMKADFLRETHKGRGLVFGTGTPITNTLGEEYVMTKYLAPEILEAAGIRDFDDWAANFAQTTSSFEYSPDGVTFKPVIRLNEFINAPELSVQFNRFGEYLSKANAVKLANIKLPTPRRKDVMVPITPTQEPWLETIAERGEKLREAKGPAKKGEDNWLKLSGDARKISLDVRLYDPHEHDEQGSKANHAVKDIRRILEESKADKGAIVVFSDFFQHKGPDGKVDFNLFDDIRKKLMKGEVDGTTGKMTPGVPKAQIAIIQEAKSRAEAEDIFAKVRTGSIRVLMGSTDKMGIGTNIQDRLKALLHLDQPWRPDQVEQREGRIERSGNMFDEVEILRYVAEPQQGTVKRLDPKTNEMVERDRPRAYDLQMYQQLAAKAHFQEQFLNGDLKSRTIEDTAGEVRLNSQMFEMGKAMASGNPDAMRLVKLEHDLRTFSMLQSNWRVEDSRNRRQLEHSRISQELHRKSEQMYRADAEKWENNSGDRLTMKIGTKTLDREGIKEFVKTGILVGQLMGQGVEIATVPINLQAEESRWRDDDDKYHPYVRYSYRLAGETHDVPLTESRTAPVENLMNSFAARARQLAKRAEDAKEMYEDAKARIPKLEEELAKPSPYGEKLAKMEAEREEIRKRMGMTASGDKDEGAAAGDEGEGGDEGVIEKLVNDETGTLDLSRLKGVVSELFQQDVAPSLQKVGVGLRDIASLAVRALYPRIERSNPVGRMLGVAASPDAVDALMKVQGDRAKTLAEFQLVLRNLRKFFDRMPQEVRVDFINRMQTGEEQRTDDLKQTAAMLREIMEAQRQEEEDAINLDRKSGEEKQLERKANYFHNWWDIRPGKEQDESDGDRISRMFTPRRPLEGTKGFNRKQSYTLVSGMESGGVPVTTNPITLLEHRIQDGMKWITARQAWHQARELDLRKYVRKGQRKPAGFDKIDDKIAKVYFPAELEYPGAAEPKTVFHEIGEWYVESNMARLMNNMLSVDHIRGNSLGKTLMWMKNVSTAFELGWSPFHAVFESIEAMSSMLSLGIQRSYNQGLRQAKPAQLLQGMKEILASPAAPLVLAKEGAALPAYIEARARLGRIGLTQYGHIIAGDQPHGVMEAIHQFRELRKEKSIKALLKQYPDLDQLVDDMFQGGLVVGQHRDYQVKRLGKTMTEAWTANNPLGAVWRGIPTLAQGVMYPLFNIYIPNLKYGLFLRMMSEAASEHSRELENGSLTRETLARRVADSVENRFGELNFDNLFLNRSVKTALQFVFRSSTYKLGTVREIAGAGGGQAREFANWAKDAYGLLTGGGSGGGGRRGGGEGIDGLGDEPEDEEEEAPAPKTFGEKALPRLDTRAAWVMSLVLTSVMLGAVAAKLLTHKWPWQWIDDDEDEGLDLTHALYLEFLHPRTGEYDSRDKPVRISLPTYIKEFEHFLTDPAQWTWSSFSGIVSHAIETGENKDHFGNYVYDPNASLGTKTKQIAKYNAPTPFVFENFKRGQQQGQTTTAWLSAFGFPKAPSDLDFTPAEKLARDLARHNPETPEELEEWRERREALENGTATRQEMKRYVAKQRLTWLQRQVKGMSYAYALMVWDKADDREREDLHKIMQTKRNNALKSAGAEAVEEAESEHEQ